ncbi:hypothetical protein EBR44_14295, partial [bacterium]|nr:hypothetical protein [bacterium]
RRALDAIASSFANELSLSLHGLAELTGRVYASMNELNSATQERGMSQNLSLLNGATRELAERSLEAAAGISLMGQELGSMKNSLVEGRREMSVLSELGTTLRSFDSSASDLATHIDEAAQELIRVASELQGVGETVATAPQTMKRLADQAKRTGDGVDFLAATAVRLDESIGKLSQAAESGERLSIALARVVDIAPDLERRLGLLSEGATGSVGALSDFSTNLSAASRAASKFSSGSSNYADASNALASLGSQITSLSSALPTLTKAIASAQSALTESSSNLNDSTSASAQRVQRELDAATAATGMVSKRLVELVNTIIEQTRRQQAAAR